MNEAVNRVLSSSDIQVITPLLAGATSWQCVPAGPMQSQPCPKGTVVVKHGPALPVLGTISNTAPEGADLCSIPVEKVGVCKGDITVGSDGKPHTHANNQYRAFAAIVESGYRNPVYNIGVGSNARASAHTYGFALDFQATNLRIPGKTDSDMMCIIKLAEDGVPGVRRSAAELKGSHYRTQCDFGQANHVHIDVGVAPYLDPDSCQAAGTGDLGVNITSTITCH